MRRENWYRMGLMWSVSAAVASAVRCNPDPRVAKERATVVTPEPMPSDARFRERFAARVGVRIIFKPERRAQCSPITHTLGYSRTSVE